VRFVSDMWASQISASKVGFDAHLGRVLSIARCEPQRKSTQRNASDGHWLPARFLLTNEAGTGKASCLNS
jgi:hypothetical protein